MDKLLLLGGSAQQTIAINKAKEMGIYTILCDYLEDNPGKSIADKFFLESTTNKEAILEIAKKEKIDGIIAYASDPAAPTAAYVAEKLNLPGIPFESAEILCNKDKFRKFLKKNDFNTPFAKGYTNFDEVIEDLKNNVFKMPILIKPVDSSGSKGVSKVNKTDNIDDIKQKLENAMNFSHSKRIIIEEYVNKYGYQVAGDGLSIDGELVFRCFANDHFDKKCVNPFVPISASFPYSLSEEIQNKIHNEIQRLISLLNIKTATYNFDIRVDDNFNVYLMEIAPRNGGNYIPQIIKYATGVDLVEYAILAALGKELPEVKAKKVDKFFSYYAVHSLKDGILDHVEVNPEVKKNNIIDSYIIKKPGDNVNAFTGANTALGCFLMKFDNMPQMLDMMDNSEQWIKVVLKNK